MGPELIALVTLVVIAVGMLYLLWEMRQLRLFMRVSYDGIRTLQLTALRAIKDNMSGSDGSSPSSSMGDVPHRDHEYVDQDLRWEVQKLEFYNVVDEIFYELYEVLVWEISCIHWFYNEIHEVLVWDIRSNHWFYHGIHEVLASDIIWIHWFYNEIHEILIWYIRSNHWFYNEIHEIPASDISWIHWFYNEIHEILIWDTRSNHWSYNEIHEIPAPDISWIHSFYNEIHEMLIWHIRSNHWFYNEIHEIPLWDSLQDLLPSSEDEMWLEDEDSMELDPDQLERREMYRKRRIERAEAMSKWGKKKWMSCEPLFSMKTIRYMMKNMIKPLDVLWFLHGNAVGWGGKPSGTHAFMSVHGAVH